MKKSLADKMILEYRDRIFGFAMEKTRNIDLAQELASDIICAVYTSFLHTDHIANTDGYVYRIARNVWSRHVERLQTGRKFLDIDGMEFPCYDRYEEEEAAMIQSLRKEIGYLSERQRVIIYLHYYQKQSVDEIARKLELSGGTVKWHLSDARIRMKEGISMENQVKDLELNPIKFVSSGHDGRVGSTGDTSNMFDSRLKQNIAWACYHEPRTLDEIARIIGVPKVYVADSLARLVDYAYIDQLDDSRNPRYLTNMIITDLREKRESFGAWYDRAATLLCEKYFARIFDAFEKSPDHWGLTCDGDDLNFIKHNLVMIGIRHLRMTPCADYERLKVKRPDGGCFLAYADITDDGSGTGMKASDKDPYWVCGDMLRDYCGTDSTMHFSSLSIDCRFCTRTGGWRDNLYTDGMWLARFLHCGKESLSPEEYKRLCDKGYLYEDRIQPVMVYMPDEDKILSCFQHFLDAHFTVPEEVITFSRKMDAAVFAEDKKHFPRQTQDAIRYWDTDLIGSSSMLPRLIERMLENGMLNPLTEIQKKAAYSIFCFRDASGSHPYPA